MAKRSDGTLVQNLEGLRADFSHMQLFVTGNDNPRTLHVRYLHHCKCDAHHGDLAVAQILCVVGAAHRFEMKTRIVDVHPCRIDELVLPVLELNALLENAIPDVRV